MNEIVIYSDIGPDFMGEGVTDSWVKDQLDAMKDASEITVRINSMGGDVFHGFAIHNLLKEHPANITVKVDGLAASAASVIAMAGDTVDMASNAMMMVHNPWTFAIGDSEEMLKAAERLDKVRDAIVSTYEAKTSLDAEEIAGLMDAETWMTASDAVDRGFADATEDRSASIENSARPWIMNMPEFKKETKSKDPEPTGDETPTEENIGVPLKIAARLRLLEI
jgi:ATP-dependent Clp protease protease subunit